MKKAGAERGRLTKAEKHRLNKQKKAEEAAKQAEIEAVKEASLETFNVSSYMEDDSPKKSEVHSARQARILGAHSRSLFKELNQMAVKLGEEIYKTFRANDADSLVDETATTMGKAFSRYSGGRGCYIPIICDSGCSKSIVFEGSVRALGSQIHELDKSLKIISERSEYLFGDRIQIYSECSF